MKLYNIQYMRALAALLVVYVHARHQVSGYSESLVEFGSIGVDLFFVISGFIMVWIAKESDTPISFMKKRILRIAPLYWAATLAMALIVFLFPHLFKTAVFEFGHLIKSLLFIPHYSRGMSDRVGPLLHPGWTLNYEMYFYLVFAISLLLTKTFRLLFIASVTTVCFAVSNSPLLSGHALSDFLSYSIVFEFIAGAIAGTLYKADIRIGRFGTVALFLGSIISFFALAGMPRGLSHGVPALLFFVALVNVRLPKLEWASTLGDASYSLYLSHLFVMGACRKLLPPLLGEGLGPALAFVAISALLSVIVGLLVYKYIETGILKRRNWTLIWERLHSRTLKPDPSLAAVAPSTEIADHNK